MKDFYICSSRKPTQEKAGNVRQRWGQRISVYALWELTSFGAQLPCSENCLFPSSALKGWSMIARGQLQTHSCHSNWLDQCWMLDLGWPVMFSPLETCTLLGVKMQVSPYWPLDINAEGQGHLGGSGRNPRIPWYWEKDNKQEKKYIVC